MSLKTQGMLVSVTITKPQLTAKDDKATGDAEAANNAKGAGQYRKDLYPKHLIAPMQEVESQTRAYVRSMTLPWGTNSRLLPSSRFVEFANALATYEVAFNQAVTVFMQNYSNVLIAAQQQQGDLYDADLYPDTSTLRAQFSFGPRYQPVTDDTDFRVQINDDDLTLLKAQVRQQVEQDTGAMAEEAVMRLKQTVAALGEAMGRPTRAVISKKHGGVEVRPPIFRDSVVDNITEVASMLEGFASMLSPQLNQLVTAVAPLGGTNPDALRQDDQLRASMKATCDALLVEIDMAIGAKLPPLPDNNVNPLGLTGPAAVLEAKLDEAFGEPTLAEQLKAAINKPAPVTAATPSWLDMLGMED